MFRTIRWRESMSKLINMKEIKKHWLEVMELDAWRDRCMISFGTWKLTLASWYQVSVHSLLYRPCPVLCLSFQFLWDSRFEQIRASQPISGICTFFVVAKLLTHFRLLLSLPKFSRSERIQDKGREV